MVLRNCGFQLRADDPVHKDPCCALLSNFCCSPFSKLQASLRQIVLRVQSLDSERRQAAAAAGADEVDNSSEAAGGERFRFMVQTVLDLKVHT